MNAVIYARSERWERDGTDLAERIEKCQAYAAANDLQVVQVFQDENRSGTTLDRPGFSALCELLTNGSVEAIIVSELAQLSRNGSDGELLADGFDDLGIKIYSVTEGRVTPDKLSNPQAPRTQPPPSVSKRQSKKRARPRSRRTRA